MEMPISVMIVLFVSIAIGIIVLQMATGLFDSGREQLEQFSLNCDEGIDFYVESAEVTPLQVSSLVDLCYNTIMDTTGGIYMVICKKNNKTLIGSTKDFVQREQGYCQRQTSLPQ